MFETVIQKIPSGIFYFMVPEQAVGQFSQKRVCCQIQGEKFHCAFMPKKEGGYFIHVGGAFAKKMGLTEGMMVTPLFTADESDYQFAAPETLLEVLRTDPEADAIFHGLTEGNQRGLMYLVNQVKSVDKQIERALKIASRLKEGVHSPRIILKS